MEQRRTAFRLFPENGVEDFAGEPAANGEDEAEVDRMAALAGAPHRVSPGGVASASIGAADASGAAGTAGALAQADAASCPHARPARRLGRHRC